MLWGNLRKVASTAFLLGALVMFFAEEKPLWGHLHTILALCLHSRNRLYGIAAARFWIELTVLSEALISGFVIFLDLSGYPWCCLFLTLVSHIVIKLCLDEWRKNTTVLFLPPAWEVLFFSCLVRFAFYVLEEWSIILGMVLATAFCNLAWSLGFVRHSFPSREQPDYNDILFVASLIFSVLVYLVTSTLLNFCHECLQITCLLISVLFATLRAYLNFPLERFTFVHFF